MKILALVFLLFILLSQFSYGLTVEEQMNECEKNEYKDLCLSTLAVSNDVSKQSSKSLEELLTGCENSEYKQLCISIVARSVNNPDICDNINDEFNKNACLSNFDVAESLEKVFAEPPKQFENFAAEQNNIKRNLIAFSVGAIFLIVAFLLIFFFSKKKNLKKNLKIRK